MNHLYTLPEVYDRIFPPDAAECSFFADLLGEVPPAARILDLGCGTGALAGIAAHIPGAIVLGIDLEVSLLTRPAQGVLPIRGDLLALPFPDCSADAVISRLFGVAYAIGGAPDPQAALQRALSELNRVLRHGGCFAIEVPAAYEPRKVMGLSEQASLGDGWSYEFQYLDVLSETEAGAVLDSRIIATSRGGSVELRAPLHVFAIDGLRPRLAARGLHLEAMYAPYDADTATFDPPPDCLRAVLAGGVRRP